MTVGAVAAQQNPVSLARLSTACVMSRFQYVTNPQERDSWPERIGKLILNFSGVESQTFLWYAQFAEHEADFVAFGKLKFKARADHVVGLAKRRQFGPEWINSASAKWARALKLAHKRNRVAHNPIIFGWTGDVEIGEPTHIGIPDFSGRSRHEPNPLMTSTEIDAVIDELAALVPALDKLLHDWCEIRDARQTE